MLNIHKGMLILSGFTITKCGPICGLSNTYWSQTYEVYISHFIGNSLFFGGAPLQLAISAQLYLSITQKLELNSLNFRTITISKIYFIRFKGLNSVSPIKVMGIMLLTSFMFGTCVLFSYKIYSWDQLTVYSNGTSEVRIKYGSKLDWSNPVLVSISFVFLVVTSNIFLVILIVINALLYLELRKIINNKKKLIFIK